MHFITRWFYDSSFLSALPRAVVNVSGQFSLNELRFAILTSCNQADLVMNGHQLQDEFLFFTAG